MRGKINNSPSYSPTKKLVSYVYVHRGYAGIDNKGIQGTFIYTRSTIPYIQINSEYLPLSTYPQYALDCVLYTVYSVYR